MPRSLHAVAGWLRHLVPCVVIAAAATPAVGQPAEEGFSGKRAFAHLQAICRLGPRPSGSEGMQQQRALLSEHFTALKATVERQPFAIRDRRSGKPVRMENLIVRFHPERKERVLLAAHYDTRPFPDRDPTNPRGRFIGANDGASGVAVLMELGRFVPAMPGPLGIDFIFFDAEEYVVGPRDPYCLGSIHFARQYVNDPPGHTYRCGVVLDMVGDAQLRIPQELHGITWPETRPLVEGIWAAAAEIGAREFVARPGPAVEDDHVPLRSIAGIPTCDVIDFDYPHWHTTRDTPEQCSAESLETVGRVMIHWLETREPLTGRRR